MELLLLLLLLFAGLAFLKGLAALLKGGLWLVALPFKLLGSVLGLLIGLLVIVVFVPALLALVVPLLLVAAFLGAGALILK